MARLAGAAVSAPCVPGAPSGGGGGSVCGLSGGLLGRRRLLGWRLRVGGGRPGLPGWWIDRHPGLRQAPLLALREGLPHVSRGDWGAGAGSVLVAVVPLGGAIGVRRHCYPGRHAWRQVCPSQ